MDENMDGGRYDPYLEAVEGKLSRKRLRGLVPQVVDAFRLLGRVAPRGFLLVALAQLLSASGFAAQVVLTKTGLDALLGGAPISSVLPPLLLIVVVSGVVTALTAVQGQFQVLLGEKVVRDTWQRVLTAAVSVPLLAFERADYYDRLQRIKSNALLKPLQLAQGAIGLVGGALGIVGLLIAVLALQPLVVPVILVAALPFFWLARRGGRLEWEFALRTTRNVRERFAFIDLMSERSPAKEVRAFVLHRWFAGAVPQQVRRIPRRDAPQGRPPHPHRRTVRGRGSGARRVGSRSPRRAHRSAQPLPARRRRHPRRGGPARGAAAAAVRRCVLDARGGPLHRGRRGI